MRVFIEIDFVLHNLIDMGVLCTKMMGFKFSKLYTSFWAPMSPGAHSAATRHIAPPKMNRLLQT